MNSLSLIQHGMVELQPFWEFSHNFSSGGQLALKAEGKNGMGELNIGTYSGN